MTDPASSDEGYTDHPPPPDHPAEWVELQRWAGPWPDDDRDANFKHDVALYCRLDPLSTLTNLSGATNIPVGALSRYILAKWAAAGAEGLMTIGASALNRMTETIDAAEAEGSDEHRLRAYHDLAAQIAWLRYPIDHPEVYP